MKYSMSTNIKTLQNVLVGVVLYKNTREQISKLIDAVRSQTCDQSVTLSCWNNCGSDYSWIKELDSDVVVYDYESNRGFGGGHNALMEKADDWGYYLALNPDGELHRDAVAEMLKLADGVCVVEAKQVPHEHPKTYDKETHETDWSSGACLMIARETVEKIGGFADEFFMYCEDVDLSWRVRQAGGKCLFADRAWFYHDVEQDEHRDELQVRMNVSGVILATKWRDQKKARKWKDKLKKRGVSTELMDDLENKLKNLALQPESNVSNFAHDYSFTKVRW